MKKVLCVMVLVGLLAFTGCSNETTYKEGTYEGTANDSYGGQENIASAKITIDNTGKITAVYLDTTYTTSDGTETTKKALKDNYGMKKGNSSYGKADLEWYEQVENLEKVIIEKQGIDFIKLDDDGKTDAVSGCTIQIEALYNAVNNALNKAK